MNKKYHKKFIFFVNLAIGALLTIICIFVLAGGVNKMSGTERDVSLGAWSIYIAVNWVSLKIYDRINKLNFLYLFLWVLIWLVSICFIIIFGIIYFISQVHLRID